MSEMSEVDAMKAIDEALSALQADARPRVLAWLNAKFGGKSQVTQPLQGEDSTPPAVNLPARAASKTKSSKKAVIPKILKDLSLNPVGRDSLKDFMDLKAPSNLLDRCTTVVYYFSRVQEVDAVTADHVYTAFKALNWRLPSDLVNTLQQAGSKGWLDTATSTDIKVTPIGENLVEHDLPKS